jgi:DNA-binding transcriptional LysR family regulator
VTTAEQILTAASGLTSRMRSLNDASTGKLSFAASAGVASTFLPPILAAFRKSHPGVDIAFDDMPAHELVGRMLTTDAEFALGSAKSENPEVTSEPILKGRLSAVGINEGSFAARKQISWDELASFPTVTMRKDTLIRINIDAVLAKFDKTFVPTFEVSLFNTALSMTAAGLGFSPSQFPTLVAKPLVRPALDREVFLVRRIGRSLSPAAAQFVDLVRSEFGKIAKRK